MWTRSDVEPNSVWHVTHLVPNMPYTCPDFATRPSFALKRTSDSFRRLQTVQFHSLSYSDPIDSQLGLLHAPTRSNQCSSSLHLGTTEFACFILSHTKLVTIRPRSNWVLALDLCIAKHHLYVAGYAFLRTGSRQMTQISLYVVHLHKFEFFLGISSSSYLYFAGFRCVSTRWD